MAYRSFEDLEVWKRACRLAVRVYETLRDCRDYGLRDQMTRAAVSIASNIAEGAERDIRGERQKVKGTEHVGFSFHLEPTDYPHLQYAESDWT